MVQHGLGLLLDCAGHAHDVQYGHHFRERASDAVDRRKLADAEAASGIASQLVLPLAKERCANVVRTTPRLCSFTRA